MKDKKFSSKENKLWKTKSRLSGKLIIRTSLSMMGFMKLTISFMLLLSTCRVGLLKIWWRTRVSIQENLLARSSRTVLQDWVTSIPNRSCTETSNLQISSLIKISQETPISNWEILGSVENWESILSSLKPMWEHLTTWVQNRSRKAGTIKSLISGQLGVFFMKLPV